MIIQAKKFKKSALVALILTLVAAFLFFDIGELLSLQSLKRNSETLAKYYLNNSLEVILAYFLIYVATTALSLPGAAVLTLAGGALLGFWSGVVVVSFASTIGATLAFLLSRFLFKDWVQARFGERLGVINRGIEDEGAFYLFTLRLVPLFPFFMVNLLMGLTPIRTLVYFVVSQIGMLPGTLAYVNAGTQLSKLNSIGDVLSFNILISFVILGVLPIASKKLVDFLKRRRT